MDRIGKVCWSVFGVFALLKVALILILPGLLQKAHQQQAEQAAVEAAKPKILRLAKSKVSIKVVGYADELVTEHDPEDHSAIQLKQTWENEQESMFGQCTHIPGAKLSQGSFASYVTAMTYAMEHSKGNKQYGAMKMVRKSAGTFGKVPGYEIDYDVVKDGEVEEQIVQYWVRDKDSLTEHVISGDVVSEEGRAEFIDVVHSTRYDGQPYVEKKLIVGPKKPLF